MTASADDTVPLLLGGGGGLITFVGRHPLLLGRDPGCDLEVADPHVSRHHALIWFRGGRLSVRDLGSALGTKVGSRRLGPGESLAVCVGEEIVLAERVRFAWDPAPQKVEWPWRPTRRIVRSGKQWAVLDGIESATKTLETTIGPGDLPLDETQVMEPFELPDRTLVNLTVSMEAKGPAGARFDDPEGRTARVRGDARVVLLFLLAKRRLLYDRGWADTAWVDDHSLGIGLWGGRSTQLPASRLNTLVTRVRSQLETSGLPRELIEKRPGETRLGPTVGAVAIQGWSTAKLEALPRS